MQLVVCLLLFGIVFLGRGLPEGHLASLEGSISELIHKNTDFRAAFSKVGQSVAEGEPVVQTFGVLWSEVFGNGTETQDGAGKQEPLSEGQEQLEKNGEVVSSSDEQIKQDEIQKQDEQTIKSEESPQTEKEGAAETEDQESKLLDEETITPVMGVLTSGFGYRIHPIDGEWKEHDGIDISADVGTPILSFASGEVEYIGESPAYGLYLQVKHDDGVSSFYAHCSQVCVKKGQKVAAGEEIAKVGITGNTTGAHLHFELKKDGKRVDPALYVETKTQ
jgi:murein DD-endopeptidase MepM/ murein hydrolase activator NlpD